MFYKILFYYGIFCAFIFMQLGDEKLNEWKSDFLNLILYLRNNYCTNKLQPLMSALSNLPNISKLPSLRNLPKS